MSKAVGHAPSNDRHFEYEKSQCAAVLAAESERDIASELAKHKKRVYCTGDPVASAGVTDSRMHCAFGSSCNGSVVYCVTLFISPIISGGPMGGILHNGVGKLLTFVLFAPEVHIQIVNTLSSR